MTQYSGSMNTNSNKVSFSKLSRNTLMAMCCLVPLSGLVNAQQSSIAEAIDHCSNENNSLKRLVCYDRLAKSMRQYSGLNEAVSAVLPPKAIQRDSAPSLSGPAATVATPAARQPTSEEQFGLERKRAAEKAAAIDKLYAKVLKVAKGSRNLVVFTLDNGQIWRQSESSTFTAKAGDTIYVERGAFGSFYMGKDNSNRRAKVKRDE